jgi:hypothetical protein
MDALEASAASARLTRREHTDEEIVGIGLVLLAHVHDGDVRAFAEYLARDGGMPFEEAQEVAGTLGCILEERRKTAANPGHPV